MKNSIKVKTLDKLIVSEEPVNNDIIVALVPKCKVDYEEVSDTHRLEEYVKISALSRELIIKIKRELGYNR